MTTEPTLTPAAFAAKWKGVETTEKASSQPHTVTLCRPTSLRPDVCRTGKALES